MLHLLGLERKKLADGRSQRVEALRDGCDVVGVGSLIGCDVAHGRARLVHAGNIPVGGERVLKLRVDITVGADPERAFDEQVDFAVDIPEIALYLARRVLAEEQTIHGLPEEG